MLKWFRERRQQRQRDVTIDHYMDLYKRYSEFESIFEALAEKPVAEWSVAESARYQSCADLQTALLEEMRLCVISFNIANDFRMLIPNWDIAIDLASRIKTIYKVIPDPDKVVSGIVHQHFNTGKGSHSKSPVTKQFRLEVLGRIAQSFREGWTEDMPTDHTLALFRAQTIPMLFHMEHDACAYIFNVPRDNQ